MERQVFLSGDLVFFRCRHLCRSLQCGELRGGKPVHFGFTIAGHGGKKLACLLLLAVVGALLHDHAHDFCRLLCLDLSHLLGRVGVLGNPYGTFFKDLYWHDWFFLHTIVVFGVCGSFSLLQQNRGGIAQKLHPFFSAPQCGKNTARKIAVWKGIRKKMCYHFWHLSAIINFRV